jgi:hypothetical protein
MREIFTNETSLPAKQTIPVSTGNILIPLEKAMTNVPNSGTGLYRKLVSIFVAGISLGVFISGVHEGLDRIRLYSTPPIESASLQPQNSFSRAEYERLKIGMLLEAVEAILGQGIETSQTSTVNTFVWEKADGSKINVTFERGKLKSKSQTGLK